MNKIKRIIAFALSCMTIFCVTSCKKKSIYTRVENEGYAYYYNEEKDYYYITGDKEENNPSCWIIEPYLNGKEVKYFGRFYGGGWTTAGVLVPSLINVKELYLPYNMLVPTSLAGSIDLRSMPELPQKVFLVNNAKDNEKVNGRTQGTNGFWLFASEKYAQKDPLREIYFTPIGYEYRIEELNDQYPWTEGTKEYTNGEYHFYLENTNYVNWYIKICKANTSYMFNYDNSPNDDYFFIRDYEYGVAIENTPYEPIREGYTFEGWYKEPECINAWDFETDTLPETLYNENNEEVYQETKLYAKWIENPKEEPQQEEAKPWWSWILGLFGI